MHDPQEEAMDTLVTGVAIVAVLGLIAAVAAPALVLAWRRVMGQEGPLRLAQALRRRALAPEDATGQERAFAVAARRCALCSSVEECDAWLATGAREGSEHFCPNATFLENLEREKKRAQP
jgi:hypothetical protein